MTQPPRSGTRPRAKGGASAPHRARPRQNTPASRAPRGASTAARSTVVRATERFATSKPASGHVVKAVLAWLAVAVLVVGAVVGLAFSPVMQVSQVSVVGVGSDEEPVVRSEVAPWMGTPVLTVPLAEVQRAVEGAGLFERVTVTRSWPQGLHVAIVPRTPAVQVKNASGTLDVFDHQGEKYSSVSSPLDGVPVAQVKRPEDPTAVRAAVSTMQALTPDLRREVRQVTVSTPSDVRFRLGQITVLWGGGDEGERKARIVEILWKRPGISTINVSAPSAPVTS